MKDKLKVSKCAENELRNQVDAATVEVDRQKKEIKKVIMKKDNEIDILKQSILASTADRDNLCNELQSLKKIVKCKDDEIYNLETFKSKNLESVHVVKKEVMEHKTENKKLVQHVKILEKKISDTKEDPSSCENNNNEKIKSLPSNNLYFLDQKSCPTSYPSISSSVSTLASLALPTTSPSMASSPRVSADICNHQPQCTLRQPKPTPADKCSGLVHMGSKYHEHFLTSVPARYGPHDNCMAVEYENYGCSDCIWFKKWGQLHGYPDLWPLKYIQSGTYSDQTFTDN